MKKAGRFICAFAAFAVVIYLSLIHPLLFRDRFFDINTVKAYAFEAVALCAFALFFIGLIMRGFETDTPFGNDDLFLLIFMLVSAAGTYLSPYRDEAFTGEMGRGCGLIFITAVGAMYFTVSHTPRVRQMIYSCLTLSGTLVCALAVMNFFKLDPLSFYTGFPESNHYMFISTIGNTSVFGSFLAIFLPLVIWRLYMAKSPAEHTLMLIASFVGCCALIAARCDAAYIALALCFMLSLCLIGSIPRGRIAEAAAVFTAALFGMRSFAASYAHFDLAGSISGHLLAFEYWYAIAGVFVILSVVGFVYSASRRLVSGRVFGYAFFVMAASAAVLFVYYSFINPTAPLAPQLSIFRLTKSWGNSRGYIWDIVVRLFKDAPLPQLLLGYGPDTLGLVASDSFLDLMLSTRGMIIDNAHNLPLQLLITTGVMGLTSFSAFVFCALRRIAADAKERPIVWGALVCALCYLAVSLVGVEQAVTTPLFVLMLAARRIGQRSSLK